MNRRRRTLALVSLLWAAVACGSTPEAPTPLTGVHLQGTFVIPEQIEGQKPSHSEMDYLLYLPDGYGQEPQKQWPLIVFLHGAGGQENDSKFVMSAGLPEVLFNREQPENFAFIVVSPQAFASVPWWEGDTLAILNALVDEIVGSYEVDPDRVYLTGLSMGGYGAWWLATTYADRFAAMVSVSGSGYRTPLPPGPETVCKLEDVPVWAIHGARDFIADPTAIKLQVAALTDCGGEVKWTLYPDAGHGGTYRRAYRDPEVYAWLLEHPK